MKHPTTLSGVPPRWSEPSVSGRDPIERFRDHLRTLLSHRLAKGQTVDDVEARAILAYASQLLQEDAWR